MSTSAPPALVKGHCPSCGPDRMADVVGHHHSRYDDEETGVWGETDFRILRCRGCGTVYFQKDSIFSEEVDYGTDPHTGVHQEYLPHKITHWPEPPAVSGRMKPSWSSFDLIIIDNDLASLFDDIYVALNNKLGVLSAIGIRTVFDRASELLGVDPAKTFGEKLSELVQLGKIGVDEKNTLDILTDAGSAAAHRGWKPKATELDTMMKSVFSSAARCTRLPAGAPKLGAAPVS